jgi:AcrR family transcriptional regulator
MSESTPRRRYHSPERRARAEATRRRILEAAERLFAESGYGAVTMEAIARSADVSVATVYLNFPNRVAIVGALAEEVTAAPDLNVELAVREIDPLAQLRLGAQILRRLNQRSWLIADILRSARGVDDGLAQLWVKWQDDHLYAVRRAVEGLVARGALRPEVTAEEAADILYAIGGTEVYRALVRERGWSPQRYEAWLIRTIRAQLLI